MDEQQYAELRGLARALEALARESDHAFHGHPEYKGVGKMLIKQFERLYDRAKQLMPDDYYINEVMVLELDEEADERSQLSQVNVLLGQLARYLKQTLREERRGHKRGEHSWGEWGELAESGRNFGEQAIEVARRAMRRAMEDIDFNVSSGRDLSGQDLNGGVFSNQKLDHANFSGSKMHDANFSNSRMRYANFSGGDCTSANFSNTDLRLANVTGTNFSDANLSNISLRDADASGAVFNAADLSNGNLRAINAEGAHFNDAKMENANFRDAALAHAHFNGANMTSVNLRGADVEGADFTDATLTNAIMPNGTPYQEGMNPVHFAASGPRPPRPPRPPAPPRPPGRKMKVNIDVDDDDFDDIDVDVDIDDDIDDGDIV